MRVYYPEEYDNLLEKIDLTAKDIAEQIKDFKLSFSKVRNNVVEWEMKLPMFVDTFYKIVVESTKIPEQKEFVNKYLEECHSIIGKDLNDSIKAGIEARALRTYPSLVRDVIFNKYISEHCENLVVKYNIRLDVEEGIDMMLETKDGKYIAICLFTETARAYIGRAKKQYRHSKFENVEYEEVPVNFKGSVEWGDFFLYGDKEYKQIKTYI